MFTDRRRISTSTVTPSVNAAVQPAKKPKLTSSVLSRPSPFAAPSAVHEFGKSWEYIAIDVDPVDLVPTVIEAEENDENEKVVSKYIIYCNCFIQQILYFCILRLLCSVEL